LRICIIFTMWKPTYTANSWDQKYIASDAHSAKNVVHYKLTNLKASES